MKITMTIETGDPADVVRIGQALAGGATMAVTLADTAQVPAKREKKEAPPLSAPATAAPAKPASASAPTEAGAVSVTEAPPSEADILGALNDAVAKVGVSGAEKVRNYMKANYQNADGTPARVSGMRADQKPAFLKALKTIATGELVL